MATYQVSYKKKFHASVVRADLVRLARLTAGEFTHDGGWTGTLTCPESYEWIINQELECGLMQSSSKK